MQLVWIDLVVDLFFSFQILCLVFTITPYQSNQQFKIIMLIL